ncbi:MAG: hypothetical protein ACRCYU_09500 [Nocardioides sp.]
MLERSPNTSPQTSPRRTRRRRRLASSFAAVAGVLLAGCGFSDATEVAYTPANGANSNPSNSQVAVLGAAIVSTKPSSGTLVATVVNKSPDNGVALTAVAGADEDGSVSARGFKPQRAKPDNHIDLSDKGAVKLAGPFAAGDFVNLQREFDNGDRLTMQVPVVPNSGHFADLDGPAPPPETPESDSESESAQQSEESAP